MADASRLDPTVDALRGSALFRRLAEAALARVADRMVRRRYRRGEVIFHEGDPGDALHLVTEGLVKIGRISPDGDEAIVAALGPGEAFGELVLLDGAPRSATATALEATVTLTLARDVFVSLVDDDPSFRWALFAGIAAHHRRLTDQLAEAHFLDLAGRLARQLARLARDGTADGGAVRLGRLYTQSELAAMIGGTRPRVNRLIGEFVDAGLIRVESDDLVIVDLEALERRAEW
ncbi:MAG TPA: Crp/Fnr family transcriptional regulator [Candidatus Limnocylindrales bacterium]|nr:Crp/Fnr family transcriptional regulator [Candidatus Limnocylindrales bacterium]